ncbi:N-terminal acetyltransferase A, auxiliary subunit [Rhizoctonia solani]|uniref:N-terminal acetyltransferase A, auxiliary subunit n=1 Tax=Rhizoctonia solani TaxID=456999 RepID=A0A8H7M4U1_9AGAM|nr:N-terminal acetyltransferase A, auxiliary subunit [Rhizoctonia solani]
MPPKALPKPVVLASKEQSLFKELLSLYETRQYKKAIKTADTILKKAPTHGDDMHERAGVTNMPGKRDEGVELVRKGLALGLESHIAGMYAAQLQMQLRQFDQLVQTRHTLLALRPTMRQSWVALAVAYQMNDDLERADKNVPDYDFEHSELLLYHLRIMENLGKHDEVLAALDVYSKQRQILDRTAIVEFRGVQKSDMEQLDNLTDESRSAALASLKKLVTQYQRGIPSLFVDIKSLYKEDEKRVVVGEIVEGFLPKLKPQDEPKEPKLSYTRARASVERAGDFVGRASLSGRSWKTARRSRPMAQRQIRLNTRDAYRKSRGCSKSTGLFTRMLVSPSTDLTEMQSLVYLLQEGDAHKRAVGTISRLVIQKLIRGFSTIRWEDRIREHNAYRKAAVEAVKIYIRLHDDPSLVAACTPKLTSEEKKAKAKAVKAASKEPKKSNNAKEEEIPPPKDDDPDGLKLLKALQVQDVDVWLMVYDVAIRRIPPGNEGLNLIKKLSPDHHELHWRVVDFRLQTASETTLDASVKAAIDQSLNDALAALKIHGAEPGQAEAEGLIFQVLHPEAKASIQDLLEGVNLLQDVVKSKRVDEFRAEGQKLHPLSTALRTEQELESLRSELVGTGQKAEEAKPVTDAK